MKQFQFEVKNHNNLRKELARVKRFAKNEYHSSIFFQIYTALEELEKISQVTDIIDQEFPEAYYYGCQTQGNIIDGKLSEQPTIIICTVFEFDTTSSDFIYIDPLGIESDYQSLQDVWDYCNKNEWVKGVEITTSFKGSELLGVGHAIENLREDVEVFGGVAVNPYDTTEADTYIFAKGHEPSTLAAIAIVFGGPDVFVETDYITGWEGLGKTFTVTDCDGKRITEIDNEPAMNIYRNYLGIEQDDQFVASVITFPLLIASDGIECIRQPLPCENKNDLELMVDCAKGMKVRLSYGEKNAILSQIKERTKLIKEFAPDAICVYSCAARRAFWGDDEISRETTMFEDFAPTIGFYTRGEILRIGNFLHYFNSTMVLAVIREGEAYEYDFDLDSVQEDEGSSFELGQKLIKYISAVTGEIQGQYNSTMRGMASIYKSMFLIDMDERSIVQLDNNEKTKKCFEEKENYFEKFKNFLRTVITEDNLYEAMIFCDFHTLKARLRYKNVIDRELISKEEGWFRAQFVVINRNANGIPTQFVFTTQIIDEEKKAADQQQKIIQSLADIYFTLHLFDLENDTVTEVSTQELVHRIYSENSNNGCQKIMNRAIEQTTFEEYIDKMKEFTDLSTLDERMKGRKTISAEFIGYGGWAKASFVEVECDNSGKLKKVLYTTQIIDDEKRKEERLVRRAMTDELTGLYNRRAYEADLLDAEAKANRDVNFVLVAIDVNGLKKVNDDLGHEAGDELIVGAANCISKSLSPYGKVYRIGGDEFAAITFVPKEQLESVREELNKAVEAWSGDKVKSLSLSCGFVSSGDYVGESITDISKVADKEMYADKEAYYRNLGQDRRGQRTAFEVLSRTYVKIIKVNLTTDTFSILQAPSEELDEKRGYTDESLSKWLYGFAMSGQVCEDDKERYLQCTTIEFLRDYFTKDKKIYSLSYKRLIGGEYKKVIMEIIPDNDFAIDNLSVYLYVKSI